LEILVVEWYTLSHWYANRVAKRELDVFMKKKVIVIGGGISGLSAAHRLQGANEVTVLEKEMAAGGWCEKAARTFRTSSCEELLALAQELGLSDKVLECAREARKRYLFFRGKLEAFPSHPLHLFTSPLLKGIKGALLTEWAKPVCHEEETLFDFAARRFGKEAALRIFDAMSIGVFATSSKNICVDHAFPKLKQMEKNFGSLTKALFSKKKAKKSGPTLFSFEGGTKTLVDALVKNFHGEILFGQEALSVKKKSNGFEVATKGKAYEADAVLVALPPKIAGELLKIEELKNLAMTSLCMVKLEYEKDLLGLKGFGYLVPSVEQIPLLGVIFDSCIFPKENKNRLTRLTAMMPMVDNAKEKAVALVRDHLGIAEEPHFVEETICKEAIFAPKIGHGRLMHKILGSLPEGLALAGNYIEGVSVNDCIKSGITAAKKLQDGLLGSSDRQTRSQGTLAN
jgi:oxygen-dependent protoporphyrinogen oxidase